MKDTFRVAHTVLHTIPNPFHHHGAYNPLAYYHETSSNRSFFSHGSHGHVHHSLEDHLALHSNEQVVPDSEDKTPKKDLEKSQKHILFWEELFSVQLSGMLYPKNEVAFYLTPFLTCLTCPPPNPPPEHSI
jgi:hypothetical protein